MDDWALMEEFAAPVMKMTEQEYRKFALTAEGKLYELWDGIARQKPIMNVMHGAVAAYLGSSLVSQLDRRVNRVNINGGRTRYSDRTYYIPDVIVIPIALMAPYMGDPEALNAYAVPLPLVVEVWSYTIEPYDFGAKLQAYRERGDNEIWYIHPFERTLSAWRLQADGSYREELYRGGIVPAAFLPGVSIDLDDLLDW
jgi:Uma2 family endonuclease